MPTQSARLTELLTERPPLVDAMEELVAQNRAAEVRAVDIPEGERGVRVKDSRECRIAETAGLLIGFIEDHGEPDAKALVKCPRQHLHTGKNRPTDAFLFWNGEHVRFMCHHTSCREGVAPSTKDFIEVAETIIEESGEELPELTANEVPEEFRYIPISEIEDETLDEWIWQGYVAPGRITILHAPPKVGKTTLLSTLYSALEQDGEFCGLPVRKTKVFVCSEEGAENWKRRREEFGLTDNVSLIFRAPVGHGQWQKWEQLAEYTLIQAKEQGAGLVVFDTISDVWPVEEEYDNMAVKRAVKALDPILSAGIAVILSAHSRKAAGDEISSLRGGSALAGMGDIVITIDRPEKGGDGMFGSDRRVLSQKGRFAESPQKLTIGLGSDGKYEAYGVLRDARSSQMQRQVFDLLCADPCTMAVLLKTCTGVSHSAVRNWVKEWHLRGWVRYERGKRIEVLDEHADIG